MNDMHSTSAQRMFGRRRQTLLLTKCSTLEPKIETSVKQRKLKKQGAQKDWYDKAAKPLPELKEGDVVRMKSRGNKKASQHPLI